MKNSWIFCVSFLMTLGISLPAFSQTEAKQPGKMFLQGQNLFCVFEDGVGVYDMSDPEQPTNLGRIRVDGLEDIVVRGSYVWLSQYNDLVFGRIDLRDESIEILNRIEGVWNDRFESQEQNIAFFGPDKAGLNTAGIGPRFTATGSMSCLSLHGDYLYAVNEEGIMTFPAGAKEMVAINEPLRFQPIGENDLETIYTTNDKLYVGAQTGMHLYDISSGIPNYESTYKHTRSCDPVVAKGNRAYVTMRDGSDCRGSVNQLTIINTSNSSRPTRILDYKLHNPHGLTITANDQVVICDGSAGVKILDVRNCSASRQPNLLSTVGGDAIPFAYDAVLLEGDRYVVVSVTDGYTILDVSNPRIPSVASKIEAKQR